MLEQDHEAPGEERMASDAEAERQTRGRRGWLSALIAGVALVAVVAVFGAVALGRQGAVAPNTFSQGRQDVAAPNTSMQGQRNTSPLSIQTAPPPPADWKTFLDPLGLYSLRIPANWTASVSYGTFTGEGDRTGSFSGKIEDVKLSEPALGAGSPAIYVHIETINSTFGRQWYCRARAQETLSFNGYPASQIPPSGTVWMFESYNAHFQIDVEIPGVLTPMNPGGPMNPPPTPTAPPQATVTADQTILATALRAFKPAENPLACS